MILLLHDSLNVPVTLWANSHKNVYNEATLDVCLCHLHDSVHHEMMMRTLHPHFGATEVSQMAFLQS